MLIVNINSLFDIQIRRLYMIFTFLHIVFYVKIETLDPVFKGNLSDY
jgi:hypothetical protein